MGACGVSVFVCVCACTRESERQRGSERERKRESAFDCVKCSQKFQRHLHSISHVMSGGVPVDAKGELHRKTVCVFVIKLDPLFGVGGEVYSCVYAHTCV